MIRRSLTVAAALSLALSPVAAQAAKPVRAGSATVAAAPLSGNPIGMALGDRVGASRPADASPLFGSLLFTIVSILVVSGTIIFIIERRGSSPR